MFTNQTYPDLAKATIDERLRRAPQTGVRRSARLISLEIRRSRQRGARSARAVNRPSRGGPTRPNHPPEGRGAQGAPRPSSCPGVAPRHQQVASGHDRVADPRGDARPRDRRSERRRPRRASSTSSSGWTTSTANGWPTPRTTSAPCGCARRGARGPRRDRPDRVGGPDGLPAVPARGRGRGTAGQHRQRLPVCGRADPLAVRRPRPEPGPGRRPHAAPLLPGRGRPPRRARVARRHPVAGAAGPLRRRGRPTRVPRRPRPPRRRRTDPGRPGRRPARRPARRGGGAARRTGARRIPRPGRDPASGRRHPLGRRALQRPPPPRRDGGAAGGGPAGRARASRCAAARSPSSRASR